ncbi:hypothetical protein B9Z19DRAFT_544796 [Tuber borchii]|uniref:Uncharacterized protein n=1 Tax=Tuber borchii TaxID=42251 RepID=A0A2T7A2A9_TUBBO|nr:hypothetical protein B9Z19DRAFT_544796 [Tuber borchii]
MVFPTTRIRMTLVNTTAIAYTNTMRLRPIFCSYAITVVFTNVMCLRADRGSPQRGLTNVGSKFPLMSMRFLLVPWLCVRLSFVDPSSSLQRVSGGASRELTKLKSGALTYLGNPERIYAEFLLYIMAILSDTHFVVF